ncbi:MAG: hypothetical protein ACTS3F_01620 [Phycisphaerales bacterium]
MQAYRTIEPWIREWSIPAEPVPFPDPNAATDDLGLAVLRADAAPQHLPGVAVILRLSGRVLGRGIAFADDNTALWRATRLAWQDADANLPVPRDALRDRRAQEIAQRLTISIELAAQPIPVTDDSFESLDWRATPGAAGVAIRRADRWDATFPSELALRAQPIGTALRVLAHAVDPSIESLAQLRERVGVPYHFKATHLAQIEPELAPEFLHRAGRLVLLSAVDVPALHAAGASMAANLIRQRWRGAEPHGLHGEVHAPSGRYRQHIAPPPEQAIVALALATFANTDGVDPITRQRVAQAAADILEHLAETTEHEKEPLADPTDAALIVLAAIETIKAEAPLTDPARELLDRAANAIDAAATDLRQDPTLLSTVRRSVIAAALARAAAYHERAADPERANAARRDATALTRQLYLENDAGSIIALMPWAVWASQSLADQRDPDADRDDNQEPIGAALLEEMRHQLINAQIQPEDVANQDADLVGGFVFTRGRSLLPNWQSIRPTIGLAAMLATPDLTPDDQFMPALSTVRSALRFTLQLQVTDAEAAFYAEPDRSLGGVRRSPWNHEVAPDATALALLAVAQTLDAVADWSSRRPPIAPIPAPTTPPTPTP